MTEILPKAALVTIDYPPERGGVARYLGSLVRELGEDIDVFVPKGHAVEGPGSVYAVPMFSWGIWKWRPMIRLFRNIGRDGYSVALVSHVLPVGTAAWIASHFGGPEYVVLLHGLDLRLATRTPFHRWLVRRILKKAKKIVVNSNVVAQELLGFDASFVPKIVTPGVDPISLPTRAEARQSAGLADQDFIVLAVTRHVPRKGLDRLIEALGFLPDKVKLVLIGDGHDRPRLERIASHFQGRVRFLTQAEDQERDFWYAAADIFALPVRDDGKDIEGFGMVFLEAAMAGLPVLAGESGGAIEAIEDQVTGYLINPHNPREIAEAIKWLMKDEALRARMGQAGKERAEREFRWHERGEEFREILFDETL